MAVADVSDWRETLKAQNNDNQIVEEIIMRKIVGVTCFYNMANKRLRREEDIQELEDSKENPLSPQKSLESLNKIEKKI